MAPRGRAAQPSRDTKKTIKQSNQLSLPHQDDCNTRIDISNVQQNIEQLQAPTMGESLSYFMGQKYGGLKYLIKLKMFKIIFVKCFRNYPKIHSMK